MKKVLAAAGLCIAMTALAQTAPPPKPSPTPDQQVSSPVTESISVDITNIEVVVTDSKGNRVTGLTRDDFEIRQDGVIQPITNFYAVDGQKITFLDGKTIPLDSKEATPPDLPKELKAKYIIYIDNLNIQPQNRNRMFKRLKEWVQQSIGPRAEAEVISYNRSLKTRQKFTSEAGIVVGVLEEIERETGGGTPLAGDRKDAIERINDSQSESQALSIADTYSKALRNDLEFTVDAIKNTLNGLAGIEGRKIFIYVSEGLPQEAGAELYDTVQRKYTTTSTLSQFEYDMSSRYASIVQAANAQGVTIWALDASGLQTDALVSAENRYIESRPSDFLMRQNQQGPIQLLAEQTGGMAAINTNDWKSSLDELSRDFTSFYSLGYRSARSAGDRPHSIDITVKRKGLHVRSRKGLVEKSPETRVAETVLSALDYSRDDNPLNVTVRLEESKPYDRDTYELPIRIVLPIGKLGLLPAGDHYEATYLIYLIVRDSSGDKSDLQIQKETIRVPEKELKVAQTKDQPYELKLLVRDGAQRLSMAVRDMATNLTSYYQKNFFVSSLPPVKKGT
ncbi:MAG TPA: VWA domain-containing protein [Thermoanaerobaculia bacterium]